MQALNILIAMVIGFSAGNFLAFQSHSHLKQTYEDFLSEVMDIQRLNQNLRPLSDFQNKASKLPLSADPNLNLHK